MAMLLLRRHQVVFLVLLVGAACPAALNAERTNVVKLNKFNFGENVKTGAWFVKFYAPWCTHCQRLAPIWEKLADQASDKEWPVKIADVDCTSSKDICERVKVKAFPTLALILDGTLTAKYQGEPKLTAFEEWLNAQKVLAAATSAGSPAAAAASGQKLGLEEAKPEAGRASATGTQAAMAVLNNLFQNFPTKSKILNLYFYGAISLGLVVTGLCTVFRLADNGEEEEHDKDD
mmetsp:Transcript_106250/g.343301  ORF Transcript_106250/g.343301 Transcript_106250/m.343301 type:complete len:233 (+) Transcript_106250:110-808(+)